MKPGPRLLAAGVAVAFVLSSCGGSDSSDDSAVSTVATTEEGTEPEEDFTPAGTGDAAAETTDATVDPASSDDTAAAPTTASVDTAETDTAATDTGATTDGAAAAGAVEAVMVEWSIDAPTDYSAGEVTFTATNNGSFPHEFVVIQGDGYESLPLADGGAVIEDDLAEGALLGRTERIGGGDSADLAVTLEPGNYVLLCNLGGGVNSHAGQGQFLDITVS